MSGFQRDGYSHGMASGFILSFGFCFLELYSMKPDRRADERNGQNPRRNDDGELGRVGDSAD